MNPGQTRVLVILLVIIGLEVAWSPAVKSVLAGQGASVDGQALRAAAVGYGAGGLALLALASWAPQVATWIAALFLALMLFNHSSDVVHATTVATSALGTLAGPASPLSQNSQGGR